MTRCSVAAGLAFPKCAAATDLLSDVLAIRSRAPYGHIDAMAEPTAGEATARWSTKGPSGLNRLSDGWRWRLAFRRGFAHLKPRAWPLSDQPSGRAARHRILDTEHVVLNTKC